MVHVQIRARKFLLLPPDPFGTNVLLISVYNIELKICEIFFVVLNPSLFYNGVKVLFRSSEF